MNKGSRYAGFELVHLLVLVAAAELAFNRLATRELRPDGDVTPPWWHQVVDTIGLFSQYFAATLALGILAYLLIRMVSHHDHASFVRYPLVVIGGVFLALGATGLLTSLSVDLGFVFETTFMVMALALLAAQIRRGGDIGVKIGLLLMITPLAVHYYGVLAIRLAGEEALWNGLPERVLQYGQWTMIVAALLSPYCFAPRPLISSLVKPGPIIIATFVSVLGVILLRQYYMVAMRLAHNWLGLDIGPGAPMTSLFTYAFALGTMTWTLAACVAADSAARRDIGIGIALVVLSGYGFTWPVQFLVSMVGLVVISDAATKVKAQEAVGRGAGQEFYAPPISRSVWRDYVGALGQELSRVAAARSAELAGKSDAPEPDPDQDAATAPARSPDETITLFMNGDEPGYTVTHLVNRNADPVRGVRVRVEAYNDSITTVDIHCGSPVSDDLQPAWTLFARPERLLGIGAHPEPPHTSAPIRRMPDDQAFEHRFRVRDADDWTDKLMDPTLRARANALIDGWVAFWPGLGLRYRVHPGRGAPVDHPIPITEMAFRGSSDPTNARRMAAVVELLAAMTERGLADSE